jgi:Outer membrane protein beta-barrel domain
MSTKLQLIAFVCMVSLNSFAMVTELGVNYGYSKKTFNASNYYQTESKTASLAFYITENWALEASYTDGFYESQESDTNSTRTVQQRSQAMNASGIYNMFSRKSPIQPFVKAGAAYIIKNQTVKYQNANAVTIPESTGWAPSYGLGLKVNISELFSIKLGYEVWQTPLSDGTTSEDNSFKAGLSWLL